MTLELLGFEDPQVLGPLALRQSRVLGFPGWALVNLPSQAHHALRVVEDFRRATQRAKIKPGEARKQLAAIAKRLERSAPELLPTFYEEAGRAFLAAENPSVAGQLFSQARQAERTHGLPRDLARLRGVALEFALAGALAIKALSAYAVDLTQDEDADTAYLHFRELCLERTQGGLPPWNNLHKELRQLARCAGREVEHEERAFLRALLDVPSAMSRARKGFWTSCRSALSALCAEDPSARGALLSVFPDSDDEERYAWWLGLLAQCGALEALGTPPEADLLPATLPPGGASAWFNNALVWTSGYWTPVPFPLFGILRAAAPRLRAEGTPLVFHKGRRWDVGIDADLLDLALELGVPVAEPGPDWRSGIALAAWAAPPPGQESERGRDLAAVARHPAFRERLAHAVGLGFGSPEIEAASRGKAGLRGLREDWLAQRVEGIRHGGLPDARAELQTLIERTSAETLAEFPAHAAQLAELSLDGALARSVRGGSLHELSWPAFEAAVDGFRAAGAVSLVYGATFPHLALSDGKTVAVLDRDGRVLTHELRYPPGSTLTELRYVGAELYVRYRTKERDSFAYWSGACDEPFEVERDWAELEARRARVVLEGGGCSWGEHAFFVRDPTCPESRDPRLVTDGDTWWRLERSRAGGGKRLVEFDPLTGAEGATSLPRWFSEFGRPDEDLDLEECDLIPCPAGSPLGDKDGLYGWRVRRDPEAPGGRECQDLLGRTFRGALGAYSRPWGLLTLPGAEGAPRPLSVEAEGLVLWDLEGRYRCWEAIEKSYRHPDLPYEVPYYLPPVYVHLLRPRDPAGSKALRELGREDAAALLAAAAQDRAAGGSGRPQTLAALAERVPALSDAGLKMAVLRQVEAAALAAEGLANHLAELGAAEVEVSDLDDPHTDLAPLADDEVSSLLGDLCRAAPPWPARGGSVEEQWIAAAAFFETGTLPPAAGEVEGDDPRPVDAEPASPLRDLAGGGFAIGSLTPAPSRRVVPAKTQPSIPTIPQLPDSRVCWEDLVGRVGAVAYRTASACFAEERSGAVRFLEAWAETPFASAPAGRYRRALVTFRGLPCLGFRWPSDHDGDAQPLTCVVERAGNRYMIRAHASTQSTSVSASVLECALSGEFKCLPGATIVEEELVSPGWGSPAEIRGFLAELEARGPWPPSSVARDALVDGLGLSVAEASLVELGFPRQREYGGSFLPKEVRAVMRLKVKQANRAREALSDIDRHLRARVLASAFPGAAQRWEDELAAAGGLRAAWSRHLGERVSLPEAVVEAFARDLAPVADVRGLLTELLVPTTLPAFSQVRVRGFEDDGDLEAVSESFGLGELRDVVRTLPFVFEALPVGDPFRVAAADLVERTREVVRSPNLWFKTGHPFTSSYAVDLTRVDEFLSTVEGTPFVPPEGYANVRGVDDGVVLALRCANDWKPLSVHWRPARWIEDRDHAALAAFDRQESGWERCPLTPYRALKRLFSPAYDAFLARVRATPVPEGSYEGNPLHSAPDLVERATALLDLSQDGALLYLQLLTLAAPTTTRLKTLNAWTPARVRRTFEGLEEAGLVIKAKRRRAGREHFLPGGWEDLPAPDKPMETWKLPLYGVERPSPGRWEQPLQTVLPPKPLHELFAQAWARIEEGDRPSPEKR
jgi:hypothetical protein